MKRAEFKPCAVCRLGVLHAGNPVGLFWRVSATRMMIDRPAVLRRHGMELMLGGGRDGANLAEVMGPNEGLAKPLTEPLELLICESCLLAGDQQQFGMLLFELLEKAPALEVPEDER